MNEIIDWPEKVAALSPMKRRFVLAYCETDPGPKAAEEAARIAGYEDQPSKTLKRQASDLLKDRAVVDALKELGATELFASIPLALKTARNILKDPFSKDRWKAAQAVLDRIAPITQKLEIATKAPDREQVTLDHLRHLLEIGAGREALIREFGAFGLERYEAMLAAPMIDVTPEPLDGPRPAQAPMVAQPPATVDLRSTAQLGKAQRKASQRPALEPAFERLEDWIRSL